MAEVDEKKIEEQKESWAISTFSDDISKEYSNNFSVSKYYILFEKFKHNHLSHGMVALLKLGVNDATIKNYMKTESEKMYETIKQYESTNKVSLQATTCDWSSINEYLGSNKNFYGILAMFENKLIKEHNNNIGALLAEVFPILSPGVCGGAFHGLIQLGYGLSVNNTQIILEGLALLTMQSLPFQYKPTSKSNTAKDTAVNIGITALLNGFIRRENKLKEIISKYKGNGNSDTKNVSIHGNEIVSNYLQLIVDKIPKCDDNDGIKKVKRWLLSTVISLYTYVNGKDYNDFFLLHGVTGGWSLIQCLPYLKTNELRDAAVIQFLHGFIAYYVVQGQYQFAKPRMKRAWNKKEIKEFKKKAIGIIYNDIKPKDNESKDFVEVHRLKVAHIVLECLELNIIDGALGRDVINLVQKPYQF
eukprot:438973_1